MDMWILGIPTPVALAAVAVMGYLVGRRYRAGNRAAEGARRELQRAEAVIRDLETISQQVRRSLAAHHSSVLRFKEQVARLSRQREDAAWQELSNEAERMLQPTMALSTKIAHAYDEIRRHTNSLMSTSTS